MTWQKKNLIVVPVDFSGEAVHAIRTALELVNEPSGIHVIHVMLPLDTASPGVLWGNVDDEARESAVRKHFAEFLDEHEFSGLTVAVKIGDPGLEVADYAKDLGADMIVIPSHGYHGVKRVLMGSTAERVLRHAECPVLVLRRSDAS